MIDLAINHVEELQKLYMGIWYDEKYKYWNDCDYHTELTISTSTESINQFVSLNNNGEVIGYIAYNINRALNYTHGFNIINFTDDKLTFGIDCKKVVVDIFERFKFRKLQFYVFVGNPIERHYDKMVTRVGGRIVGYFKDEIRLTDGQYYDMKYYEIMRDDYLLFKDSRHQRIAQQQS